MRNIHYKGIHQDRWVFGDLIRNKGIVYLGNINDELFEIAEETLSEFTGVLDFRSWNDIPEDEKRNVVNEYNQEATVKETIVSFEKIWKGMPIYENDMLECHHLLNEGFSLRGFVKFINGCFGVEYHDEFGVHFLNFHELMEYRYFVIGNMFQVIPMDDDKKVSISEDVEINLNTVSNRR